MRNDLNIFRVNIVLQTLCVRSMARVIDRACCVSIIKLTYFGAEFEAECVTFRPASTVLDHASVVACGLTRILA